MAVNTAIPCIHTMKIYNLIESEAEGAQREANCNLDLYRGLTEGRIVEPGDFVRLPIRTDRQPRDATRFAQLVFNALFEETHGVKDIRNRCAFATTDIRSAGAYAYGDPSMIVKVCPLNASKLAFAPGINDSNTFTSQVDGPVADSLRAALSPEDYTHLWKHDEFFLGLSLTNSVQQLQEFIQRIKPKLSPSGFDTFVHAIDNLKAHIQSAYKVVTASEVDDIPDDTEVMVFDAPYFYATSIHSDDVEGLEFDSYDD